MNTSKTIHLYLFLIHCVLTSKYHICRLSVTRAKSLVRFRTLNTPSVSALTLMALFFRPHFLYGGTIQATFGLVAPWSDSANLFRIVTSGFAPLGDGLSKLLSKVTSMSDPKKTQDKSVLKITRITPKRHTNDQSLLLVTADAITLLSLQASALLGIAVRAIDEKHPIKEENLLVLLEEVITKIDSIHQCGINIKPRALTH